MTRRSLLTILLRLVALYVGVVALVWLFQRRLLYAGMGRPDTEAPEDAHLVVFQAGDGVAVHALEWDAQHDGQGQGRTVVYFHGNGEVIGDDVWIARELVRRGLGVVLVEYRGYGRSRASERGPTEAGLYADAEAVLDGIAARGIDRSHVVLWGASLGTGVAAEMATRGRGAAVVLVAPYTSMAAVASAHFPWLPVTLLLEDRYDTLGKASRITTPTLVVHGTLDEVVPFEMGKTLADAIARARLVTVHGRHHMDLFLGAGARHLDELAAFARGVRGQG